MSAKIPYKIGIILHILVNYRPTCISMKKVTSTLIPMFGLVAIALTVFTMSDSFASDDMQKLEEQRQFAVNEQLKQLGIIVEADTENIQEDKKAMTLKESISNDSINSVNAVKIKATFNFAEKNKVIDSFSVFQQLSGFDKTEPAVFVLQGVVGIDKSLLYRAADMEHHWRTSFTGIEHRYSEFGVNVTLEHEEFPIRSFDYRNCKVSDYSIDTLHDKEESYNKVSTFVIVDNFEFTCSAYQPLHYGYEEYIEKHGMEGMMEMSEMTMEPMKP